MWPSEGKYQPLFEHLLYSGQGKKIMTFKEIEALLERPLPPSARKRAEWWSNSSRGHSQAEAWRRAGYKTARIDLANETIEFRLEGWPENYVKPRWPPQKEHRDGGLGEGSQPEYVAPGARPEHPLFGIWEGRVTLLPGVDYSKPAFDLDDDA